jgi:hypothetical protein
LASLVWNEAGDDDFQILPVIEADAPTVTPIPFPTDGPTATPRYRYVYLPVTLRDHAAGVDLP